MEQDLKYLPLGHSDITTILTNNFSYVDKTRYIYELIKIPSKYFLSRPRRFGKSTLVSTFNEIFKANKELFKDQWIYNSQWTWEEYPIIKLDFNLAIDSDIKFHIMDSLKLTALSYELFNEKDYLNLPYDLYFKHLVINLARKYKKQVVILIDEYDKPILDVIDNVNKAINRREVLKGFYTIIKGLDEYIRFIFLTGVSRFSKVGVFSGLNNLTDISMSSEHATLCGITDEELEKYYHPHIENLAISQKISYSKCLLKIKNWYNGFCFSRNLKASVYNPFSTLSLLDFLHNPCLFIFKPYLIQNYKFPQLN